MEGRHRVSPGPYAAFRALNAPGEVPAALDCESAFDLSRVLQSLLRRLRVAWAGRHSLVLRG